MAKDLPPGYMLKILGGIHFTYAFIPVAQTTIRFSERQTDCYILFTTEPWQVLD